LPDWPIQRLRGERERVQGSGHRRDSGGRRVQEKSSRFKVQSSKLEDRGQYSALPVVLYARDPRRGDVVVVCNATAQERGVRVSMPLAEAAALAEHGGKCLILPHDPAADLAELARLAEHCERFSPMVGWGTVQGPKSKGQSQKASHDLGPWTLDFGPSTGPDCLFLDVTGIGVLFGGEEKLGHEVVAELTRFGYEARVVVADTIGAAWAAARQTSSKFTVQSLKFRFQCFEPTLNLELGTLNLDSLRLPAETIDLLSQLGMERLEQLLALPRESLKARFGELLLLRIDQLLGAAQEIIVPHRPLPQFIEEQLLEYPAERRELVEQILRELVHRIATALANRREGVLKLGCRLDCAPGQPVLLEVGLFRPSADKEHLWDLLQMQLEQAALPGPVGRVRLEAALTARLENRQGKLFAGGEHEAQRQFALLIDRCSSRLGSDAVLRPQLTADPLPERAVRYKAGVGGQVSGIKKFKVQGSRFKVNAHAKKTLNRPASQVPEHGTLNFFGPPLLRPLMLFSPPQALEVLSIAPNGPPVSFRLKGKTHELTGSAGPERIETGWWRGRSVRRDYWRVETATGQRFWLFRQLGNGQWFLHGEYA